MKKIHLLLPSLLLIAAGCIQQTAPKPADQQPPSNTANTNNGAAVINDSACSSLSESDCGASNDCYASYVQKGPSLDETGMPLLNYYFDTCLALTEQEKIQRTVDMNECEKNDGTWTQTYGRPKGFCVQ